MLLAFDDTDSREGGCTTHLAFHALLALPRLALRGLPRLVRLNPNVPHKTRGNAAVVLPLGLPRGPQVRVGELRGREVLAFPEGPPADLRRDEFEAAWQAVRSAAQPQAQPAMAAFADPPPEGAYWQAVRTRVEAAEAAGLVEASAAFHAAAGTGRALVGCLAGAAWAGPPSSYEFIAYREPARRGTPRAVEPAPLRTLDAAGTTFHSWDAATRRLACVPRGPDPVLLGLRGRDPDVLAAVAGRALLLAAQEPIDGWLLWATNQASGDHVTPVAGVGDAPEWGTVAVHLEAREMPRDGPGGHVAIACADARGEPVDCVAFEPTKGFRATVRQVRPGDRILAVGALGDQGLKLEKLRVDALADVHGRRNPACPRCGRPMRSKGPSTGYRCPADGERLPWDAAALVAVPRSLALGWHEVPVGARRHLHRPAAWETSRLVA